MTSRIHLNLFAILGILILSNNAHAIINITISPVSGDSTRFRIDASGSADMTTFSSTYGGLLLDNDFFNGYFEATPDSSTLTFGGQTLTKISGGSNQLLFDKTSGHTAGTINSFDGGPATALITNGGDYFDVFSVGIYNITGGASSFGDSPTGTVTILSSPIPEPSTYAAILGLSAIGFALARRRR